MKTAGSRRVKITERAGAGTIRWAGESGTFRKAADIPSSTSRKLVSRLALRHTDGEEEAQSSNRDRGDHVAPTRRTQSVGDRRGLVTVPPSAG